MSDAEIIPATSAADYSDAKILIEEYAAGLGVDLRFQGIAEELADLRAAYGPPRGFLLLLRNGGQLAGCVGMRSKGDSECEMKRLYLRASSRGAGLGRRLAQAAIERARGSGCRRIVLDTLEGMAEARALYESLGFSEIASYYPNPLGGTRYLALEIAAR